MIHLKSFPSPAILTYIASLNAILFWYKVSELVVDIAKKSRIINLVGEETLAILLGHQLALFGIQFLLYHCLGQNLWGG